MSIDDNDNNAPRTKKEKRLEALLWRRNKVMQLHMEGLPQTEIASQLKVSQSLVSMDIIAIREESKEQLHNVITRELPLQWRKTRTALQFIQKEALNIWKEEKHPNAKLSALNLFSEAQQAEFELVSNSTVLNDAMQWVKSKNTTLKLDKKKEVDDNKNEIDEDQIEDEILSNTVDNDSGNDNDDEQT